MDKNNPILVLVVDDSPTMRLLTTDALEKAEFRVVTANNGLEALTLLKKQHPDVILLDVEMPEMDGFTACREIRHMEEHRFTPIMMVTGLDDYESINKAFAAGATDFTTKPINANLLGYRVQYMVRTSNYFNELQLAEKKVRVLNNELVNKLLEIQQNAAAVARFVPEDFLKVLNRKQIADIRLGDCVEKTMTVLFLDIKSFTSLAEQSSSVEIFNTVNTLMSYLNPPIIEHKGFIDKYIGDALMALFDDADDAVAAALGMLQALDQFNQERINNKQPTLKVGIGINTGSVIVGTVGFESRMDCSVISDAVNIASRVESLTRQFGIDILISGQTYQRLKQEQHYFLRSLGITQVKGKSLPINIYELFSHDAVPVRESKSNTLADFAQALLFIKQQQYSEAQKLLNKIIADNPLDLPAQYFLKKIEDAALKQKTPE